MDLRESVKVGATLLDQAKPGWAHEVDVDRLDMSGVNTDICALTGQRLLFSYEEDEQALFASLGLIADDYDLLDQLWLVEIASRTGAV